MPGSPRARLSHGAAAALASALLLPLLAAQLDAATAAPAMEAIVIGAGVAGLKAAADLAEAGYSVTVLEARNRTGGRVWTVSGPGGPVELGAQWIHGSKNPVRELAAAQGWKLLPSSFGSGLDFEAVSPTAAKPVSDKEMAEWEALFEEFERFVAKSQSGPDSASLETAVSAFKAQRRLTPRQALGLDARIDDGWTQEYAASPSKLSLNYFDSDARLKGGDTIIAGGYNSVPSHLHSLLVGRRGRVLLNTPVTGVEYTPEGVTVTADDGQVFKARFAVVTLPVGVLKAQKVAFKPPLPEAKANAIKRLGMGTLNKVILAFPPGTPLPQANWLSRIPLPSDAGRWREFFSLQKVAGRPTIVAFTAGDAALYPPGLTDAQLVSQASSALRAMLGPKSAPQPAAAWVTRWQDDPWSLGAYSVVAPGARGGERKALAAPTGGSLFWAGEATSKAWPATVQGAWASGAAAAQAAAKAHPLGA